MPTGNKPYQRANVRTTQARIDVVSGTFLPGQVWLVTATKKTRPDLEPRHFYSLIAPIPGEWIDKLEYGFPVMYSQLYYGNLLSKSLEEIGAIFYNLRNKPLIRKNWTIRWFADFQGTLTWHKPVAFEEWTNTKVAEDD